MQVLLLVSKHTWPLIYRLEMKRLYELLLQALDLRVGNCITMANNYELRNPN